MPLIRAMRLLGAIEAGTTNSSQLETLLADAARLGEFRVLLNLRGQATRIATSAVTIATVLASATARAALLENAVAMAAVGNSPTAKSAIFNSDTYLAAVAASGPAMAALRSVASYSVVSWTENGSTPVSLSLPGSSYIALGTSRNQSTPYTRVLATRRSGSSVSAQTGPTSGSSSTAGADMNIAIPIVAPYTVANTVGGGASTGYLGLLRCDV